MPPSGRMYQVVPGPLDPSGAPETKIEVLAEPVRVGLPLSVTVVVKLYVPVADGVPEIMPVVAARVSPAGRLPAVIDQVYDGVPPLAVIELEYAVPTVAEGKVAFTVSDGRGGGATASDSGTEVVCAGLPESVTVAVKLADPVVVGVPEI